MVEHDLAKVGVEGSNPFARSRTFLAFLALILSTAGRRKAASLFVIRSHADPPRVA